MDIDAAISEIVRNAVLAAFAERDARLPVSVPPLLIPKKEVWRRLGISEDSMDGRRRLDPTFPPARQRIGRSLFWLDEEVNAYIRGLPAVS